MSAGADSGASAGMEFLENISDMIALLVGYRTKLEEAGFSSEASEQMCVQMHAVFLKSLANA